MRAILANERNAEQRLVPMLERRGIVVVRCVWARPPHRHTLVISPPSRLFIPLLLLLVVVLVVVVVVLVVVVVGVVVVL